jgi:hypothetical protein
VAEVIRKFIRATRETARQDASVFKKAMSRTRLILVAAMLSHNSCVDLLLHIVGHSLQQQVELVETSVNQGPMEVVAYSRIASS